VIDMTKKGFTHIFSYEEAIGYMIGNNVYDKDGVCAAAVFAEMYGQLRKEGKSCQEELENIYSKYGYFCTNNRYFFCYEKEKMEAIFKKMKDPFPSSCGRFKVKDVRSLRAPGAYDSRREDKKPSLPVSKSSDMITLYFENGAVVTFRGSGTEPKLKYYAELGGKNRKEVEKELDELVKAVIDNCLEPEKNDLVPPKD